MVKSKRFIKRTHKIFRYWTVDKNTRIAYWHATHKPPRKSDIQHGNFDIVGIKNAPNNLRYDKITQQLNNRDKHKVLCRTISTYGDRNPIIMICQKFPLYNHKGVYIGIRTVLPENSEIVCIANGIKRRYPLDTCLNHL